MHRFVWDVHYQPLPGSAAGGGRGGLPIQAIPYNTAPSPTTPWVSPGTYSVRLTVNGKSYTQPITVKQDPRVRTPALTMRQIYTLTEAMYFGADDAAAAANAMGAVRAQIAKIKPQAQGPVAQALDALDAKAAALEGQRPQAGAGGRGGGRGGPPAPPSPSDTLWAVSGSLAGLMNSMQAADVAPTANTLNAIAAARQNAARVMARWRAFRTVDLPAVNVRLKAAGLPEIAPGAATRSTH
jgi:hypothetical protein